jgi:aspartate/methionine/tyrosine aminotransferase
MQRHAVCVLSGDAFGLQTAGYVRLGMVEPVPVLQEACRRIAALALEFMKETVND